MDESEVSNHIKQISVSPNQCRLLLKPITLLKHKTSEVMNASRLAFETTTLRWLRHDVDEERIMLRKKLQWSRICIAEEENARGVYQPSGSRFWYRRMTRLKPRDI